MPSTPLFTKTFDFLQWLMGMTNHFPRSQRYFGTKRLLDAAFDFQERIVEANSFRHGARAGKLVDADAELNKVRLYIRFAYRMEWMTEGQYHHAAGKVAEIGKLLGAWKKSV